MKPTYRDPSHAVALAGLLAVGVGIHSLRAASLDDVQFWTGTGPHRAGLVIDWTTASGSTSLLWGFRWTGSATGLDMLKAVIASDPGLFAHLSEFSWGTATLGLGYDLNPAAPFSLTPSLTFDPGGLALSNGSSLADDARTAADPGDLYREGWNTGFWAYYLKSDESEDWTSALAGSADRALVDGAWDGYAFAPGFSGNPPTEPVPALVPEPAALTLLLLGLLASPCARRRQP